MGLHQDLFPLTNFQNRIFLWNPYMYVCFQISILLHRNRIVTPGRKTPATPKRTPARFGLWFMSVLEISLSVAEICLVCRCYKLQRTCQPNSWEVSNPSLESQPDGLIIDNECMRHDTGGIAKKQTSILAIQFYFKTEPVWHLPVDAVCCFENSSEINNDFFS